MKTSMHVVYAPEKPPEKFSKSIFLAGPSPRAADDINWRPEALRLLEEIGYDGVVFVPLPRIADDWKHGYENQIEWEVAHLHMADAIVFWVPRNKLTLPGFTTNVEYGMFLHSGKLVLGFPADADSMRYLAYLAEKEHVPIASSLEDTLRLAVERVGDGAERSGGERMVPLHIWRLPHFERWLVAQKAAGNRLDGARVLWVSRPGATRSIFAFALHVDVHIAAEGRNKINEFVIGRPDISAVVAYRKHADLMDTEVLVIREFRSPATTSDGFIHEVPGGSSWTSGEDPFVIAAHELQEETGFAIDVSRLRRVGSRQLCGTLSAHQAQVFACEVTEEELAVFRREQASGAPHGVVEDSERTYVEVHRLGDVLASTSNTIDWSMLGMILVAISG